MRAHLGSISVGLSLACLSACQAPQPQISDTYSRVIAVGDLHGDYQATLKAFQVAGATNPQNEWIAQNILVVQTGDQLDRGNQELQILNQLDQWQTEALKQHSKLVVLNGNHEIMNVMGDFRYVAEDAYTGFEKIADLDLTRPELSQVDLQARARLAALLPGGPLAKKLAQRPIVYQYQDLVFVHGGLEAKYATQIDRINQLSSDWLMGRIPDPPPELLADDGPIWSRAFSNPDVTQGPDCQALSQSLNAIQAKHLIVAHTVYDQINSACDGLVWRIDVGLSKAYGGPIQVLSYQSGQFQVLKAK